MSASTLERLNYDLARLRLGASPGLLMSASTLERLNYDIVAVGSIIAVGCMSASTLERLNYDIVAAPT